MSSFDKIPKNRIGFTLNEVMISIVILSISLFGLAGAVAFGMQGGEHSHAVTEANGYARAILEYALGQNLPFVDLASVNDSAEVPLNATPFGSSSSLNLPTSSRFTRRVTCTSNCRTSSQTGSAYNWKDNLRQVNVTVYWTDRGSKRSVTQSAIVRRS